MMADTDAATLRMEGGESSSRSSSPGGLLHEEHSMESLINISESSEDGLNSGEVPVEIVDEESDRALAESNEKADDKTSATAGDNQNVSETEKKKKRRISKRRERKISLSSSDRVVLQIAGVEVNSRQTQRLK